MLGLFLFGAPRVERHGQAVPLRRTKAIALLAYLALTRQPHDRDALLALLWPEFDPASARNNLRRELSLLRSILDEDLLVADRQQVGWSQQAECWVDVAAFRAQLALSQRHRHPAGQLCPECAAALTEAARLAGDDFLAGFELPDSQAFDEWLFFQRDRLRQQLAEALQALVGWHAATADYSAGIECARRWVALDPLHEPARRELMRLYAWAGQPSAALRQYAEAARLLDEELGAAPEPETTELYESIKARRLAPPVDATPGRAGPAAAERPRDDALARPASHSLPRIAGFVGRQRELADIVRLLTDPSCRLLTLAGPGGIGKTRLALQAAQILADGWSNDGALPDGVLFVPLEAVGSASGLVSALAAAARLGLFPGAPAQRQVLDHFRDKQMLVVLDNFEQLIDAAGFVGELLAAAPHLRLLVTSRVALSLRDEWFYPIDGLSFPGADDERDSLAQLSRFDAVRLFEQRARQARSDFSLGRTRAEVVRLCQIVAGMPLAIELAAAWLKVLPVDQLVAALDRSLDILTARGRDVPARHRSMRAVLDESWRLLSDEERRALGRLSVFCGGFTAAAAASVVGATVGLLADLVERSLVRCDADGRYQMHELLRQYAAEQLALSPAENDAARQTHSSYYVDFLAARRATISGADQTAAVAEILAEQANVRAAWQAAAARRDLAAIDRAGHTVAVFYEFRGRYREGAAALEQAIESLRAIEPGQRRDVVYAARLVDLGWLHVRLGDLAQARAALEEAHALFETYGGVPSPEQSSDPLLGLGMVALLDGRYAEAARLGEAVLQRGIAPQYAPTRPRALFLLAKAAHAQGDYLAARRYAEEALSGAAEHGHRWLAASLYNELGNTLAALGEYAEAAHSYQTYYTLREAFDDRRGMATALHGLGRVALCEGRSADARALFERSLAIIRPVGSPVDTGMALDGLAAAACACGDYEDARRSLAEALQLALAGASQPLLLAVLASAAQLLLLTDKAAWVPEGLELILRHPASDHELAERARRLLAQSERSLTPDLYAAAVERGRRGQLSLFTPQIQAILSAPLGFAASAVLPPARAVHQPKLVAHG